MCLQEITKKPLKDPQKVRTGYKVFESPRLGRYCSLFQNNKPIRPNIWLKEHLFRTLPDHELIGMSAHMEYHTGFHIYTSKDAASETRKLHYRLYPGADYVVKKVKYRDVVATGYETVAHKRRRVHVAKDMFITED